MLRAEGLARNPERIYRIYRDERSSIAIWREHYNHVRPHRSLGRKPSAVFAKEAA
ncbi:MAG: transposase [Proteobacteria bacterium]|nr:transposase [Pseudomonadota bacterium]